MTGPNVDLAYAVLDHIDAHPEEWDQGVYIGKAECGTVACFAGRAILLSLSESALRFTASGRRLRLGLVDQECTGVVDEDGDNTFPREMAERLLGISSWLDEGTYWERDLFDHSNTREDLGRLVEEIFGPRPVDWDKPLEPVMGMPESGCDCSHDGGHGLSPWPDRARGHAVDCPAYVPPNAGGAS